MSKRNGRAPPDTASSSEPDAKSATPPSEPSPDSPRATWDWEEDCHCFACVVARLLPGKSWPKGAASRNEPSWSDLDRVSHPVRGLGVLLVQGNPMSRRVPEWKGKDDNTAIPARVKLRIFRAAAGTCAICAGRVTTAAYDHTIALINGGANTEHNVRLLCVPCHNGVKTPSDLAQKKKDNRVMAKHVGITGAKQKIASRGFQKRPPQRTASRPVERS